MSDKTGKQFEDLTERVVKIFADSDAEIETDVLIETDFGKRQFDVVLRKEIKPFGQMAIGIEARDHSRKSDITKIDAFASKLADCAETINKGVMVNRRGYSKNALQKAKRNGIQIYRLEDRPEQILDEAFRIPVVIQETRVASIFVSGHFYVPAPTQITQKTLKFNGMHYSNFCLKYAYERPADATPIIEVEVPIHTLEVGGRPFRTISCKARITLITRNHFGYVNELPKTVVMRGELGEEPKALIDSREIMKSCYFRAWPCFFKIADAPKHFAKIECGTVNTSVYDSLFDQLMRPFQTQ